MNKRKSLDDIQGIDFFLDKLVSMIKKICKKEINQQNNNVVRYKRAKVISVGSGVANIQYVTSNQTINNVEILSGQTINVNDFVIVLVLSPNLRFILKKI